MPYVTVSVAHAFSGSPLAEPVRADSQENIGVLKQRLQEQLQLPPSKRLCLCSGMHELADSDTFMSDLNQESVIVSLSAVIKSVSCIKCDSTDIEGACKICDAGVCKHCCQACSGAPVYHYGCRVVNDTDNITRQCVLCKMIICLRCLQSKLKAPRPHVLCKPTKFAVKPVQEPVNSASAQATWERKHGVDKWLATSGAALPQVIFAHNGFRGSKKVLMSERRAISDKVWRNSLEFFDLCEKEHFVRVAGEQQRYEHAEQEYERMKLENVARNQDAQWREWRMCSDCCGALCATCKGRVCASPYCGKEVCNECLEEWAYKPLCDDCEDEWGGCDAPVLENIVDATGSEAAAAF